MTEREWIENELRQACGQSDHTDQLAKKIGYSSYQDWYNNSSNSPLWDDDDDDD